jgi:hypothetical protein
MEAMSTMIIIIDSVVLVLVVLTLLATQLKLLLAIVVPLKQIQATIQ